MSHHETGIVSGVEGGVMKDEREADGAGLAEVGNDTTVVPAPQLTHDATLSMAEEIDALKEFAAKMQRCGAGPRQKADDPSCSNCGYVWAGPRLRDLLEGDPEHVAAEREIWSVAVLRREITLREQLAAANASLASLQSQIAQSKEETK